MNSWSARLFRWGRYLVGIAAGLLLAAAFPKAGVAGFAWIAPGLMLAAALGARASESFRVGYVAGLAYYLASLSWLLNIPYRWHSIPLGPIAGWIALGAYLALYPAFWVWAALRISNLKSQIPNPASPSAGWRGALAELSDWNWVRRALWAMACAALWVALEMVLARLWGGFPWNLLGVSQQRIVPLIQVAAFTGVYGVSFCVAWGSVALLCAGSVILRRPHLTSAWMGEIILPLTVILVLFAFGFHQMAQTPVGARELKVTLVQPSIPQTLIWDPAKGDERFQELIRLSESALANPTDLLVWPEAAIPKLLRWDRDTFQAVTNLAVTHHVWMIVGSDDAEPARYSNDPKEAQYFNSSFLVSPSGILAARYGKRQLVIFGEYVPLERWLPFVKWFTPIQGSFTPGQHPVQFAMTSPDVTASVLICFEDVFGRLARESASPNTDFLVNLTNDGWFGESAAQWQHAANASFRAVENGRPLIRCTNTGLTCWYDACGRLRELFRDGQGSVYGSGFLTVTLPLPAAGEERPPTFYNRHGDWFGWGCAAVAGVALAGALVRITRVEKTLLG